MVSYKRTCRLLAVLVLAVALSSFWLLGPGFYAWAAHRICGRVVEVEVSVDVVVRWNSYYA